MANIVRQGTPRGNALHMARHSVVAVRLLFQDSVQDNAETLARPEVIKEWKIST